MLRTSVHVLATTLAIIVLASAPALSGPFGPDAKYRGGSNSARFIGGAQKMQGGPWTIQRKRTFDYKIAHKLPPPPPAK